MKTIIYGPFRGAIFEEIYQIPASPLDPALQFCVYFLGSRHTALMATTTGRARQWRSIARTLQAERHHDRGQGVFIASCLKPQLAEMPPVMISYL